jgi:hypothetical protein
MKFKVSNEEELIVDATGNNILDINNQMIQQPVKRILWIGTTHNHLEGVCKFVNTENTLNGIKERISKYADKLYDDEAEINDPNQRKKHWDTDWHLINGIDVLHFSNEQI